MNGFLQVVKMEDIEGKLNYIVAVNPKNLLLQIGRGLTKKEQEVYFILAAYLDTETGVCSPSQETIAELMGIDRSGVSKHLKSLEKKGYITIEKSRASSGWECNTYRFNDMDMSYLDSMIDVTKAAEEVVPKDDSIKTARDFVEYFCIKYKEKYNSQYLVNYKKECSIVKTRLIGKVSSEELKGIIDNCFEHYEELWATDAFPTPNIYPLTDWIGRECLKMHWAKEKRQKEIQRIQEQEDDTDKFLGL